VHILLIKLLYSPELRLQLLAYLPKKITVNVMVSTFQERVRDDLQIVIMRHNALNNYLVVLHNRTLYVIFTGTIKGSAWW
jgi:hypothetical protein